MAASLNDHPIIDNIAPGLAEHLGDRTVFPEVIADGRDLDGARVGLDLNGQPNFGKRQGDVFLQLGAKEVKVIGRIDVYDLQVDAVFLGHAMTDDVGACDERADKGLGWREP